MVKNMKCFTFNLILLIGLIGGTVSCFSTRKSNPDRSEENTMPVEQQPETIHTIVPDTFVLPTIPKTITDPSERAKYLTMHYWDRFDFTNRRMIDRPDITEQAFVDYINILNHVPKENADKSLLYTLDKATVDTIMYKHFVRMFEKYFYDPNSPFRNEELYIPVLQELNRSPMLTEAERSSYLFQLEMVMKNRVGQRASDFAYTLPSGQSYHLHELKSEYTLLLFSNPGCSTCEAVIKRLNQSKELNEALSFNTSVRTMLTILTIYPDSDLEEWLAHLNGMPAGWVHGYDKGMEITQKRLYDIKAIPTIYLLDRDKNVILKDTSIEAVESFFSASV